MVTVVPSLKAADKFRISVFMGLDIAAAAAAAAGGDDFDGSGGDDYVATAPPSHAAVAGPTVAVERSEGRIGGASSSCGGEFFLLS